MSDGINIENLTKQPMFIDGNSNDINILQTCIKSLRVCFKNAASSGTPSDHLPYPYIDSIILTDEVLSFRLVAYNPRDYLAYVLAFDSRNVFAGTPPDGITPVVYSTSAYDLRMRLDFTTVKSNNEFSGNRVYLSPCLTTFSYLANNGRTIELSVASPLNVLLDADSTLTISLDGGINNYREVETEPPNYGILSINGIAPDEHGNINIVGVGDVSVAVTTSNPLAEG